MATYEQFYSTILPANYALTKSMELTKVRSSGTLWYTKKFLVLYYYVFLSSEITTREYVNHVIESFDNYIHSLPEEVQADANRFFYSESPALHFHSAEFQTFSAFASAHDFETQDARTAYLQKAKKLYFAILMGSGGQTGVKKALKEAVSRSGFQYSEANMCSAIMDAVVSVCKEQIVNGARLTDNSVKYIISQSCIDELTEISTSETLTEQRIWEIIRSHDDHRYAFSAIENDMVAFIRNERQILYYYGYFHSKSAGAIDFEFSSLTPVGELALKANFYEFLALWEHQKLKMISQPATADLNNIAACENTPEAFGISFSPYTDVLGHILRQGALSLEQYKYIVSRRKHDIAEEEWLQIESDVIGHLQDIQSFVEHCGRTRDIQDEDSRKELLKYVLGLRADLPLDRNTNIYGTIAQRGGFLCTDRAGLERIYRIYSRLQAYKLQKYADLFLSCEADLRSRYIAALNATSQDVDPHIKIRWDLYNIRPDELILLSAMISIAARASGTEILDTEIDAATENLLPELRSKFPFLFSAMGYRTGRAKRQIVKKVLSALCSGDDSLFLADRTQAHQQTLAAYRTADAEDLLARILALSAQTHADIGADRTRNSNLIGLLKSYDMAVYMENHTLRCECCGEPTFITERGEPYVEFHHLIPFREATGPDHYLNLFALCPNCHKKFHFLRPEGKPQLYAALNANNYMQLPFLARLRTLKDAMILRSYHLEYLLAEGAVTPEEYESITA